MGDCLPLLNEEIEALRAIYGDETVQISRNPLVVRISFQIEIHDGHGLSRFVRALLSARCGSGYPVDDLPEELCLSCVEVSAEKRKVVEEQLKTAVDAFRGDAVLFVAVEQAKASLEELLVSQAEDDKASCKPPLDNDIQENETSKVEASGAGPIAEDRVFHGEPIVDRKSVFQAHVLYPCNSEDEVASFLAFIKTNRKIANAAHNVLAYRVTSSSARSTSVLQDYDDDGESAAGKRLLALLRSMDVQNMAVVVTRWFGGSLLGPVRFTHINNAARLLISDVL